MVYPRNYNSFGVSGATSIPGSRGNCGCSATTKSEKSAMEVFIS
jgi:hypothetical protein